MTVDSPTPATQPSTPETRLAGTERRTPSRRAATTATSSTPSSETNRLGRTTSDVDTLALPDVSSAFGGRSAAAVWVARPARRRAGNQDRRSRASDERARDGYGGRRTRMG